MFTLSKKVVTCEFLPKIFILNAVYRDEVLGGTNISIFSSACTFQFCDEIFYNMGLLGKRAGKINISSEGGLKRRSFV